MVQRGQYLERPAIIDAGDLTLEGLYHRGSEPPPLLVCAAPGEGGGMDAPPVAELAWACARAGHASLRFQYRGFGASQGTPDPMRTLDDARAARKHLAETTETLAIGVAGYGAGCEVAIALALADRKIARLVLIAPPPLPPTLDARALNLLTAPVLVILPALGGVSAEALAARLPVSAKIEVIANADAQFREGLPQVGKLAVRWLAS